MVEFRLEVSARLIMISHLDIKSTKKNTLTLALLHNDQAKDVQQVLKQHHFIINMLNFKSN